MGPTTAWIADALSAVLQIATPIRPFGARTRYVSRATASGFVKIWKPNRLTAKSNDSSGKSIFSASIVRNSTDGIRRWDATRVASSTICSDRSIPTTFPSGPTILARLIAGSPGPVAMSRHRSRTFGSTRARRSNPYGSRFRRIFTYRPAASFHVLRVYSRYEYTEHVHVLHR